MSHTNPSKPVWAANMRDREWKELWDAFVATMFAADEVKYDASYDGYGSHTYVWQVKVRSPFHNAPKFSDPKR